MTHAESFLQLCEPVRDQLERSRSFILRMVYQHALAISGHIEGYADPGGSGVEQTLGRADFDFRAGELPHGPEAGGFLLRTRKNETPNANTGRA